MSRKCRIWNLFISSLKELILLKEEQDVVAIIDSKNGAKIRRMIVFIFATPESHTGDSARKNSE